ncbi:protein of unknown function DUF374 [Chloroherpeton thalassium ATCC 35110]|uniref:DUF374 domain-containing protein n=1 Tax=Chloroherpeton thalassium (strain ATCC 35110 / GB-78) TaxID=517418 RepID=B3QSJ8_CHLT3|nr:DUF374 domain-containing protein [Chloroherpeton thalassium]ACF14045.1 protein of unknown function DUF374 [Chloroherpeton thalassium ATCC 35110]
MSKPQHNSSAIQLIGKHVLPKLLLLLFKSLRKDIKNLDALKLSSTGAIFSFWHGHMLTGWLLTKQCFPRHPAFAIVSLSKDGEILSNALQALHFKLVRGSSSKGKELVKTQSKDVLEKGFLLSVTPDGPRGPRCQFKYGLVRLASDTRTPIIFAKIQHHSKWVFRKSWDQFEVPKPFSKVNIEFHRIDVPEFQDEMALQLFTHELSEKL